MDYKLEVVVIPSSDIDASIAFYTDKLGFNLDHDNRITDEIRIVQLTPPGSACSIVMGNGPIPKMEPGTIKGVQLTVEDIETAREDLAGRGIDPGEPRDMGGVFYLFVDDPDGNGWAIQEWPPKQRD